MRRDSSTRLNYREISCHFGDSTAARVWFRNFAIFECSQIRKNINKLGERREREIISKWKKKKKKKRKKNLFSPRVSSGKSLLRDSRKNTVAEHAPLKTSDRRLFLFLSISRKKADYLRIGGITIEHSLHSPPPRVSYCFIKELRRRRPRSKAITRATRRVLVCSTRTRYSTRRVRRPTRFSSWENFSSLVL